MSYSFRLSRVFNDGTVLQRAPYKSVVWGFGPAGGDVMLKLLKHNETLQEKQTSVDTSGKNFKGFFVVFFWSHYIFYPYLGGEGIWQVLLDPVDDDVSMFRIEIVFSSGDAQQTMTLRNVRFADVWFCVSHWNMDVAVTSEQVERNTQWYLKKKNTLHVQSIDVVFLAL